MLILRIMKHSFIFLLCNIVQLSNPLSNVDREKFSAAIDQIVSSDTVTKDCEYHLKTLQESLRNDSILWANESEFHLVKYKQ